MFHFGWGICFFGGVENAGATIGRPPAWRSNALSGMAFLQGIRARASNARPYILFGKVFHFAPSFSTILDRSVAFGVHVIL